MRVRLQWRLARALHAFDSLILRYRYPEVSRQILRVYPKGYVKECPWWAMERPKWCKNKR